MKKQKGKITPKGLGSPVGKVLGCESMRIRIPIPKIYLKCTNVGVTYHPSMGKAETGNSWGKLVI